MMDQHLINTSQGQFQSVGLEAEAYPGQGEGPIGRGHLRVGTAREGGLGVGQGLGSGAWGRAWGSQIEGSWVDRGRGRELGCSGLFQTECVRVASVSKFNVQTALTRQKWRPSRATQVGLFATSTSVRNEPRTEQAPCF